MVKFRRPSPRRWRPTIHPAGRLRVSVALLSTVMVIGVVGYRILGLSWFDALYQTVITITTVGFNEIGPPEAVDTGYRVFTLGLALVGVASALYTLGLMVEGFVEGSLNDSLRTRREQRMIDQTSGHIVVAGGGRVGQAITAYVRRHGAEVVTIDRDPADEATSMTVVGEATDDETLRRAGIERAATLIAALDSDAANVYVTLSARALNPDLHIVARSDSHDAEKKFFQAGADRVVNPHEIGGSRMAALAMHPTLAEFLDEVLYDEGHGVTVDEITVAPGSSAIGSTLASVVPDGGQPLVIAIRDQAHGYMPTPPPTTAISADAILVVLGSAAAVDELARRVG